jgi:GT2 family glycosyltransferase
MTTGDPQPSPVNDPPLVFLGTICGGSLRVEYVNSMIQTAITPETGVRATIIEPYGPYLDDGRNVVIERALAHPLEFEYLLFVDSDIAWRPDDVRKIVAAAEAHRDEPAIYTGAYSSTRHNEQFAVVGNFEPDTRNVRCFTLEEFYGIHAEVGDGIVRVDGAGAGFMLIPRVVIDTLLELHGAPVPWFHEPIIDGVHQGEDYGFCIRAADAGFPTYLVPSVTLLHNKTVALGFPGLPTPPVPHYQKAGDPWPK